MKQHHHCLITKGGKVISAGENKPELFTYNGHTFSRHAECDAILNIPNKSLLKMGRRGQRLDLIVIRAGYMESKPCEQCIRFLRMFAIRFRTIRYSSNGCIHTEKLQTIENDHATVFWRSNKGMPIKGVWAMLSKED